MPCRCALVVVTIIGGQVAPEAAPRESQHQPKELLTFQLHPVSAVWIEFPFISSFKFKNGDLVSALHFPSYPSLDLSCREFLVTSFFQVFLNSHCPLVSYLHVLLRPSVPLIVRQR